MQQQLRRQQLWQAAAAFERGAAQAAWGRCPGSLGAAGGLAGGSCAPGSGGAGQQERQQAEAGVQAPHGCCRVCVVVWGTRARPWLPSTQLPLQRRQPVAECTPPPPLALPHS